MMRRKAFVLLSGGMDSTTNLYKALFDFKPVTTPVDLVEDCANYGFENAHLPGPVDWVEAVSVYYGQRHKKEMEYAKKSCDFLGIKHTILDVGNLLSGKSVMLTDESRGIVEVPSISYDQIQGVSPTYVPFRNGLLLSAITAHAQKWVNEQIQLQANIYASHGGETEPDQADMDAATKDAKDIAGVYFGAHAEDAHNWAYPDCTPEFIGAMANAIYVGSYFTIRLHTPLGWLSKADIVELGHTLGVNWKNTWSCYKGEEVHCGSCPTCIARKKAFAQTGLLDPTEYRSGGYSDV